MNDLEALAKLASEAGAEIEKLTWPAPDPYYPAFNAFVAAASPDVVLALVRVALAAKAYFVALARYLDPEDLDYTTDGLENAEAALRSALADLDR